MLRSVRPSRGRPLRPSPPPRAVAGLAGRKENGLTLLIDRVTYIKPISPSGDDGRGYLFAPGGPAPGEKTGLRLEQTS